MTKSCGLYLITPSIIHDVAGFAHQLEAALGTGHVDCLQLRLKNAVGEAVEDDLVLKTAEKLLPISQKYDVAFLINDRADLAHASGADGVHLGQSDGDYYEARALLGEEASIGVTCHASRHLALEAGEKGADYVAFGAFFPTQTKVTTIKAETDLLRWWADVTIVPSVAIGGINADNCLSLIKAGADFLAVSGAIWNHKDGAAQGVEALHQQILKNST